MIYDEFDLLCVDNKYKRWYWSIIERARSRGWTKDTAPCAVESHHSVPNSIIPNEETRVLLTVREHLVCHLLLLKFTRGRERMKMNYAIRFMMNLEQYDRSGIRSRLYENIRAEHRESVRKTHTGMKRSEITRQRQRDAKAKGFSPWNKGRTNTHQTGRKKMIVTCPVCGKSGGKPVMTRYHFDKCRWVGEDRG